MPELHHHQGVVKDYTGISEVYHLVTTLHKYIASRRSLIRMGHCKSRSCHLLHRSYVL
ncbi:hypothetical protein BGW80DRAFT_1384567 [Lactifluus volemus]|nr:hypothetical protein BGW80DRAFT_1384567 [Lactifluus volemus]